jgi:hypothetical protein
MYDLAAAKVYIRAWTADDHQWIFKVLPVSVAADTDEANIGPALSVRAYGHDRRDARYDQATRSALVRVWSLTWSASRGCLSKRESGASRVEPGERSAP